MHIDHKKFEDASKKMAGKSDEGGMTGVIERDSERGRVIGESQGREKTQPDQRNQTPTHNGQRGIQRGERV